MIASALKSARTHLHPRQGQPFSTSLDPPPSPCCHEEHFSPHCSSLEPRVVLRTIPYCPNTSNRIGSSPIPRRLPPPPFSANPLATGARRRRTSQTLIRIPQRIRPPRGHLPAPTLPKFTSHPNFPFPPQLPHASVHTTISRSSSSTRSYNGHPSAYPERE